MFLISGGAAEALGMRRQLKPWMPQPLAQVRAQVFVEDLIASVDPVYRARAEEQERWAEEVAQVGVAMLAPAAGQPRSPEASRLGALASIPIAHLPAQLRSRWGLRR